MSASSSRDREFRFEFQGAHNNPCLLQITKGFWNIESAPEGDEWDIVSETGKTIATLDLYGGVNGDQSELEANAQCISLVPELVRAVYTAMRALRGNMPDDETPQTIALGLEELLKRCYSSPTAGDTIVP